MLRPPLVVVLRVPLAKDPIAPECCTAVLLARHSKSLADSLVANDVMSIISLLNVHEEPVQLSCLQVLASIALASMVRWWGGVGARAEIFPSKNE